MAPPMVPVSLSTVLLEKVVVFRFRASWCETFRAISIAVLPPKNCGFLRFLEEIGLRRLANAFDGLTGEFRIG
jgi:hypothetical protein